MPDVHDPHVFTRDERGSARVRLRIENDLAERIERAAGDTPVIDWIFAALRDAADRALDTTTARNTQT